MKKYTYTFKMKYFRIFLATNSNSSKPYSLSLTQWDFELRLLWVSNFGWPPDEGLPRDCRPTCGEFKDTSSRNLWLSILIFFITKLELNTFSVTKSVCSSWECWGCCWWLLIPAPLLCLQWERGTQVNTSPTRRHFYTHTGNATYYVSLTDWWWEGFTGVPIYLKSYFDSENLKAKHWLLENVCRILLRNGHNFQVYRN